MTKSKFDAIVIGAGMSGNAAAYSMARRGLKVLQLERGEHSGSKNVQGAILYANMLEAIIPNFRDDAPLERHLVEQRFWLMDDSSHTGVHYRSDDFNELKPNRYTIIRAQFDKWFSSKVREAGGTVLCETTATKLARDRSGSVIGVYTDREGGVILADVVVLAEGVNGLLGTRAGLRDMPKPENVALAVKEMHFMPEEVIAERFGLTGGEGCVIEAGGTISRGMAGLGFLYTNKESISVGIGCLVSGLAESMENPYRLLDAFKQHPSIRPLLAGSEIKEYAAHLIPEGGFKAIPQLFGNGWVVVGDAAQLNNAVHREGSNLAMTSGLMAGEAIFQIKSRGGLMTKHNLSLYKGMLDKSFVMKDLMKHKDLPSLLHTDSHNFLMTYPTLISQAAQNFVRVDGAPKINREKATAASFINARSRWGLISDAVRSAVSWR
ncbi:MULTISPECIES: FAD-dependent oxidoreductase [Rhizobium]|uniref:Protein FixC n=4 Tax=Rhizobium TaxID=379 RepID=A0A9Q3MEN4_9HYPH|nr:MULTISPECIES: FAD-dependent oxidoreductase [Rhizobium]MBX4899093.1 FAD-dependent oxidoreductase [Rhizobium bangladeshense]MBX4938051.1 FAD-dependent oxidoreductase [Rhizobium binae]MBX4945188.1 FAD-dependent oxidoreductase [Rhizobium binae]MBX4957892.1 FAD-dependent oxidoreductase [Rhizobium lentis]MBX4968869.1 FAD-dependent oxidoreductase [Rhizobium binae]